jgi:hypothetical protein
MVWEEKATLRVATEGPRGTRGTPERTAGQQYKCKQPNTSDRWVDATRCQFRTAYGRPTARCYLCRYERYKHDGMRSLYSTAWHVAWLLQHKIIVVHPFSQSQGGVLIALLREVGELNGNMHNGNMHFERMQGQKLCMLIYA